MIKTLEESISERNWRVAREEREQFGRMRNPAADASDPGSKRSAPGLPGSAAEYAIYMLDSGGKIVSWNAGAERFKGHLPSEFAGQNVARLYPDEDQRAERPRRALKMAERTGRFEEEGWRLRQDGSRFRAHVIIDLIKNDQGQPAGFVKVIRDVSERHATALRLQDLHTANRELEQFVHIASHDLREPLRKLRTFNSLLRSEEGDTLSESARGYLDNMMAATERMQQLLASLLMLTRVTSQGQAFEPVDLDKVISDVCNDLTVLVQESGASFEVESLGNIQGDSAQLRQLFQNLISNGIKYAKPGVTPVIQISRASADNGNSIIIIVQDNGIGFDPKYREKIFGVFQRLHGRGKYAGTGVGLSICRKICERHGGQISVTSQVGEGARFSVTLPTTHKNDAAVE